jgi:hypothetical protein
MAILAAIGLYGNRQLEKELAVYESQLSAVRSELIPLKAIAGWSPTGATVDTGVLSEYKDTHKAMLIFALDIPSVDYLTDREVLKSYLFDIDGRRNVQVTIVESFWSRLSSSTGLVNVYLVVLPKSVSSDRISCLADIEANQGRIVAKRGV